MKSGDYRITVEHIQVGQPRSYADSLYHIIVMAEWIPYGKTEFEPVKWDDNVILSHLGNSIPKKKKSDKREWHESYLDFIKKICDGKWEIKCVTPFTD